MKEGGECCCWVEEQAQDVVNQVYTSIGKHAHAQTLVETPGNLHTEHAQNDRHIHMLLLQCHGHTFPLDEPTCGYIDNIAQYRDPFYWQKQTTGAEIHQRDTEYPKRSPDIEMGKPPTIKGIKI